MLVSVGLVDALTSILVHVLSVLLVSTPACHVDAEKGRSHNFASGSYSDVAATKRTVQVPISPYLLVPIYSYSVSPHRQIFGESGRPGPSP